MAQISSEFVEAQVAAQILRAALLDIRRFSRNGNNEQAASLADAVHNIPMQIFSGELLRDRLRRDLLSHQEAYPEKNTFDYVAMIDAS